MANRIMLNETSYHGAGAISEIAAEAKARGYKKAFVCSDPDLIKFEVTKKVTDVLDNAELAYEIYSDIKANPRSRMYSTGYRHSRTRRQTISSRSAAVLPWTQQKRSALLLRTRSLRM